MAGQKWTAGMAVGGAVVGGDKVAGLAVGNVDTLWTFTQVGTYIGGLTTNLTVGSSTVSGGTSTRILYDNAGTLGEYTLTGSGTVAVMQNTPTLTTPVLGAATGTSAVLTNQIWSGTVSTALSTLTGAIDGFRGSAGNVTQLAAENSTASGATQGGFVGMYSNDGAAMASGDRLGGIRMGGSSSASALRNSALIAGFADQAWVDASAYGSRLEFQNTTNGATTLSTKAILSNAGIFALGATLANTVPALKPSSAILQARLGDDSAYAAFEALTFNKVTITAPASAATLTIADGKTLTVSNSGTLAGGDAFVLAIAAAKTLTVSNSLTLAGTDSTTLTFPATSTTVAGLSIAQTFTAQNTFAAGTITTSQPLTLTQTWNAGAVAFKGLLLNITNTTSASTARLMELQVGSAVKVTTNVSGEMALLGGLVVGDIDLAGGNVIIKKKPGDDGVMIHRYDSAATFYDWAGNHLAASGGRFAFNSAVNFGSGSADVILVRDTANVLAQRNGTTAQTLRVYNTFTSSTSYELGCMDWAATANVLKIGSSKGSGGGSARAVSLIAGDVIGLTLDTSANVVVASGKTFTVGNAATTGLTAGVLAALTNASIVILDSTGQAYRIPCII